MHKRHHGLGVRLFGIKVGIDQACLGMAFIIQRRGPPFEVVPCKGGIIHALECPPIGYKLELTKLAWELPSISKSWDYRLR
jgi:hypothetical protein